MAAPLEQCLPESYVLTESEPGRRRPVAEAAETSSSMKFEGGLEDALTWCSGERARCQSPVRFEPTTTCKSSTSPSLSSLSVDIPPWPCANLCDKCP